jgi:hypothetical protein
MALWLQPNITHVINSQHVICVILDKVAGTVTIVTDVTKNTLPYEFTFPSEGVKTVYEWLEGHKSLFAIQNGINLIS